MPQISYPATQRQDPGETFFGRTVADPYRWLENDVRHDRAVADWVQAQNALSAAHLAALPGRDIFKQRLEALYDHERISAPLQRGGRYFYTRNPGLQNQAVLMMRAGPDGAERLLIDPNRWAADGASALAEWAVSDDGRRLAYAVQEGGTDWRTLKVLDVDSGQVLDDEVEWSRFSEIAWLRDGSGFFYSRYPAPADQGAHQAGVADHAVYCHRLGTAQADDRLVHATPDQPQLLHISGVADDGRYLVIHSTPGSSNNALAIVDLDSEDWTPRVLIDHFDEQWSVLANDGTRLFILTGHQAERKRIVTLDLADAGTTFTELIGEQPSVLTHGWLLGGRLLLSYLSDAKTEIRRHRLDGSEDGVVPLPGIGSAGGFQGRPDQDECFFVFTSYNAPTTIYRYDVSTGQRSVWAEPTVTVDLERIAVDQHFYRSRDGTQVPMFVVRRKDVDGPVPTLLYGYGGFAINMVPYYSPAYLAWVEQGGAVAVANIRGGGEYGKAWHQAGRLQHKQNVFDDFIAAGEYLKAQGIAAPQGLAIQGESNGGLLVAAVTNQRPDLFDAALPGVGVMDMLRYARFTGGQLWAPEFGDPAREADFSALLAYSPYHNVREGQPYPAILATTADTDDRVVPAHTFKYVAALQAAGLGPKPQLVRIDTRAGHGAGKPMDKALAELADMWAFAAHWTGLAVRPQQP